MKLGDTIVRNSYAVYNNPDNLIFLVNNELTLNYMYFIDSINRGTITYAWRTENFYPVCMDVSYISYGSISRFYTGVSEYSVIKGSNIDLWYFNVGLSSSKRVKC